MIILPRGRIGVGHPWWAPKRRAGCWVGGSWEGIDAIVGRFVSHSHICENVKLIEVIKANSGEVTVRWVGSGIIGGVTKHRVAATRGQGRVYQGKTQPRRRDQGSEEGAMGSGRSRRCTRSHSGILGRGEQSRRGRWGIWGGGWRQLVRLLCSPG
jgi:hypothetical protein